MEKLSFTKSAPDAKKTGDCCASKCTAELTAGSKRSKLWGIYEDEGLAEAQSHSSPQSFQGPGELWNMKSNAKPHMDEELTFCPAQSVSREVLQTTLCGDSVTF